MSKHIPMSSLILEEWDYLWNNKRLLFILLLVPLLFIVLFGSTYSGGKIRSMPVIYVDEDHTALSREIVQAFSASEAFDLVGSPLSEGAVINQIQQGNATVGIVIPAGFEKKVTRGEQGDILTMVDGSNMMLTNTALNAANEIVQTISGGVVIKRMEAKGVTPDSVFSLHPGYRMMYNPGLSYDIFMPLGLMGAVVQQVVLLGVSLCIVRHKEEEDFRTVIHKEGVGMWRWMYAKAVPYFLIGLFHTGVTLGILIKVYNFPFLGNAWLFLALAILFISSLIGLGLFVSAFTPNSLQATQISMLLAVLSFPLSGYTWPFMSMPKWLDVAGHFFPLTYFLDGLKEIAVKGNGWENIHWDLIRLLLITVISLSMTMFLLIRQAKPASRSTNERKGLGN